MGYDLFLCFGRREIRILYSFLLNMLSFCCTAPFKHVMNGENTKFEHVVSNLPRKTSRPRWENFLVRLDLIRKIYTNFSCKDSCNNHKTVYIRISSIVPYSIADLYVENGVTISLKKICFTRGVGWDNACVILLGKSAVFIEWPLAVVSSKFSAALSESRTNGKVSKSVVWLIIMLHYSYQ